MTDPIDHRAEALEATAAAETFDATAITHAILHLADAVAEAAAVVRAAGPTLGAMLNEAAPLQAEEKTGPVILPNGRTYRPAHDPRHWRPNPKNGMWISPAGREFKPDSAQVLGVIQRLENMRKKGTLYTTPIRPLDSAE